MRNLVLVLGLLLVGAIARADTLRVLFLGNSYTYYNDLPGMVAALAGSGNRPLVTGEHTIGGYTLAQHLADSTSRALIAQGIWNRVVLQEQSQIPSIAFCRDSIMYPAARGLDSLIRAQGAHTAFFMTWGREYGGTQTYGGHSSPPFRDYFEMQDSLRTAYTAIAAELAAEQCPAGMGWRRARSLDSLVDLWESDNSHPTLTGSYLAACVFYAAFFNSSPVGLTYTAGLDSATALFCQQCAEYAVLGVGESQSAFRNPLHAIIAWPNPFRHSVRIRLAPRVPRSGTPVTIHDALGRRIKTLPAAAQLSWDGNDDNGSAVPAGIYFLRAGGARSVTGRVIRE